MKYSPYCEWSYRKKNGFRNVQIKVSLAFINEGHYEVCWFFRGGSTPPLWRDLVKNFDHKAVTYLIFFVGTHWFQKCNFWKNSLSPFWGRRGRWGQTTSKLKITKILNENPLKIDEIQNLASATSKMASWPRGSQKGLSEFFQKIHFLNQGKALRKMSYSLASWSNF